MVKFILGLDFNSKSAIAVESYGIVGFFLFSEVFPWTK